MLDVDTSLSRSELEDQSIVHSPPNVSERDSKASGAVQESDLSEVDLRYNSSEEFGLDVDTSPSRSKLQDQSIIHSPPNVPAESSGAVQESVLSPSRSELEDQSIGHSTPNVLDVPAERDAKASGAVQESEQSEVDLLHNAVLHFPLNDN